MGLVGISITRRRLLQDVLLWMADNEKNYCCSIIEIANDSGDEVTYPVGTIVADASLADSATPAALQPDFDDALTLEQVTIADGETADVPALIRGPALVNLDEVERDSDDESDDALIARCDKLVLQGVRFVREPAGTQQPDLNG